MKVNLLFENQENANQLARMNRSDLMQDLNLDIIFKFMSRNDKFIYRTVKKVMTECLTTKGGILYRQEVMMDTINHYEDVMNLYEICQKTIEDTERFQDSLKRNGDHRQSQSMMVYQSLELLGILVQSLEELKRNLDKSEGKFQSRGFCDFYQQMALDYSPGFVQKIKDSMDEMIFLTTGGDITFSSSLGEGFKFTNVVVNRIKKEESSKKKPKSIAGLLYYKLMKKNVLLYNEGQFERDAREFETAGLAHIMKMYQNFIKELMAFFESLYFQLGFYVGGANLKIRLDQMHLPTIFPMPLEMEESSFSYEGLYDLSLGIFSRNLPVVNDIAVERKKLFVVTGANQGGKSTYLRSVGIAQVMMQAGLFVAANHYKNRIFDGIFTHFTRKEDAMMNSGKLDEELNRMNRILSEITKDSLLLCNESFATTTEREGSNIAMDVVKALYENNTHMIVVTHLFEFTKQLYKEQPEEGLFISAERLSDGTRTFKMVEKEPERTSYGLDLYHNIIGAD